MSTVLYLSGAPRVSTHPDSAEPGPRSHVLGTISGFESLGWRVRHCILGDHLPVRRGRTDGGRRKAAGMLLAMDLLRIGLDASGRMLAPLLAKDARLVYERLGLLQSLGQSCASRLNLPWVLETQGLMWRDASERHAVRLIDLARRRERAAYRNCAWIVAVSQAVKDDVVDFAGVPPDKVLVVPNGVHLGRFPPVGEIARPPPGDRLRIGFVGTLLPWQNLSSLLHAARASLDAGIPIELVIAGDGAEARPLRTLADELRLGPHMRFAGRIGYSEVPGFLHDIDLGFAGHRRTSGRTMYHSPLKLYEYAAAGRPFLASAFPDAREICPREASWLLFDPESPGELARSIAKAWERRQLLPGLGLELRARAEAEFSWQGRVAGMLASMGMSP